MHIYERTLRSQAATRAASVVDMLAAVSAMGGTEHVKAHLEALESVARPSEPEPGSSYTSDSNVITL